MATLKRVFHPTLDAWQDVDESAAKDWKDAGWRLTRPDHVDDSDAPAVGEFYVASVPVETAPAPVAEPAPKADKA